MNTDYFCKVSRTTLRVIIILAVFSIAGITLTQFYWVRKAFAIKENQFYRDVNESLGSVAKKIFEINKSPSSANNPVSQLTTNYFAVLINGPIDAGVLEFLLVTEFEKRNITADFEYGIYDCVEKCMVGGNYVSPKNVRTVSTFPETPRLSNDGYYFAVQFPRLEASILSQMGIWTFSSAVMFVVIVFFGYTLFVILKQRRFSEIQRDFINNMTHEFKTPISTIAISAEVLQDPSITTNPQRLLNYATIIQNENQRLKQQVERVLQMAEMEKEVVNLKKEEIDLHDLIRDCVKTMTLSVEASKGEVVLDLQATAFWMQADRLHFSNIIYNLLDNALKYNSGVPRIALTSRSIDKDHLALSVADNGIGIAPENQKEIFHKFYRVPTGNIHNVKGFGLGLSYVKMMVEKHGGKIRLQSTFGKGSTFHLILPVRAEISGGNQTS